MIRHMSKTTLLSRVTLQKWYKKALRGLKFSNLLLFRFKTIRMYNKMVYSRKMTSKTNNYKVDKKLYKKH